MSKSIEKQTPEADLLDERIEQPKLSEDSQAFIGLKLRELYEDVVAEPVPRHLLDLLSQLGGSDGETSDGEGNE